MSNNLVTVLTPNGRRQNVKVQPNKTILQVFFLLCLFSSAEALHFFLKFNFLLDSRRSL